MTLKELRLRNKLTQKELSEKLGLHQSTIGKYELGLAIPPIKQLKKISEVFHLKPKQEEELLNSFLEIKGG